MSSIISKSSTHQLCRVCFFQVLLYGTVIWDKNGVISSWDTVFQIVELKKQRQLCLCNKVILLLLYSFWKYWVSYVSRQNTPPLFAWKGWILACRSGASSNWEAVEGNQTEEVEEPVSKFVRNVSYFREQGVVMFKQDLNIFRRTSVFLVKITGNTMGCQGIAQGAKEF